jgi:hypothetical protein
MIRHCQPVFDCESASVAEFRPKTGGCQYAFTLAIVQKQPAERLPQTDGCDLHWLKKSQNGKKKKKHPTQIRPCSSIALREC